MLRLRPRDIATIAVLLGLLVTAVIFALAGNVAGTLIVIACIASFVGLVSRLEFAARRGDVRSQLSDIRALRRALDALLQKDLAGAKTLSHVQRGVDDLTRQVIDSNEKNVGIANVMRQGIMSLEVERERLIDVSRAALSEQRESISALQDQVHVLAGAQSQLADAFARSLEEGVTREGLETVLGQISTVSSKVTNVNASMSRVSNQIRVQGFNLVNDLQGLGQLLARYSPTVPLPLMSGWALGPAGLVYVLDLIERQNMEVVVECGSGTSTLWMALAMRSKGSGKVFAVEHSAEYAEKTRSVIESHGLTDWAEVVLSPLVSTPTPRGDFDWYDIEDSALPAEFDLLLVDGPPGATGPHARYPAGPILFPRVKAGGKIVLDDADRPDERETMEFWMGEGIVQSRKIAPDRGVAVLTRH